MRDIVCLADDLHERALRSQEYVTTRDADGALITRRQNDNQFGLSLLARFDRMASDDAVRDDDPTVCAKRTSVWHCDHDQDWRTRAYWV